MPIPNPPDLDFEACPTCGGCGKVVEVGDPPRQHFEPWAAWEALPPPSNLAVVMGLVTPIPCPECDAKESDPADREIQTAPAELFETKTAAALQALAEGEPVEVVDGVLVPAGRELPPATAELYDRSVIADSPTEKTEITVTDLMRPGRQAIDELRAGLGSVVGHPELLENLGRAVDTIAEGIRKADRLEERVADFLEYLDELSTCEVCGNDLENGGHAPGTHCDVLGRALRGEDDAGADRA